MMSANTNQYFLIDVVKVFLALLVVLLHVELDYGNETLNIFLEGLFSLAVPLFFAFSGFFFRLSGSKTLKSVKRILILYCFWLVLSMPLVIGQKFNEPHSLFHYIRQFCFSSTYSVSWYLVALMWCMIIAVLTRKWKFGFRLGIAVVLYVLCVLELRYQDLIEGSFLATVNGVYKSVFGTIAWSFPQGLLFFFIGYDYDSFKGQVRLTSNVITLALLVILFYYCEIYFGHAFLGSHSSKGWVLLPLSVFAILQICISLCVPTPYVSGGKILRNISTLLYLSHPILMAIGRKIWSLRGLEELGFVLLSFTLMCVIYFNIVNRNRFRWLKYAC